MLTGKEAGLYCSKENAIIPSFFANTYLLGKVVGGGGGGGGGRGK